MNRLFFLLTALLFCIGACYGQIEDSTVVKTRATNRAGAIVRAIDSKVVDAAQRIRDVQRKSIYEACLPYESGLMAIEQQNQALGQEAKELKNKIADLGSKVGSTDEEKAQIDAEKNSLAQQSETNKQKQDALKAQQKELRTQMEQSIKAVLKGAQLEVYNQIISTQFNRD